MNGFIEMDSFSVSREAINASAYLGDSWEGNYTIPDIYWRAELFLPDNYQVGRLELRKMWKKERWISWPEVDMQLHLDKGIIPLGWRVFTRLYDDQNLLPLEWISELVGGSNIMFPYAICHWRRISGETNICCPTLTYNAKLKKIECFAVNRLGTGAVLAIAVYRQH